MMIAYPGGKGVWKYIILVFICIMLLGGCAKKRISSEIPGYTGQQRESAARESQAEVEDGSVAETGDGSLREESLSGSVGAGDASGAGDADAAMTEAQQEFVDEDIYFNYNSAVLSNDAQDILKKKAQWLTDNPEVGIIIEGHTDSRGTIEYNLALGDQRAEAAKAFLTQMGIDPARIITISYGEERPLESGEDEGAWTKNRRDHFVLQ